MWMERDRSLLMMVDDSMNLSNETIVISEDSADEMRIAEFEHDYMKQYCTMSLMMVDSNIRNRAVDDDRPLIVDDHVPMLGNR